MYQKRKLVLVEKNNLVTHFSEFSQYQEKIIQQHSSSFKKKFKKNIFGKQTKKILTLNINLGPRKTLRTKVKK